MRTNYYTVINTKQDVFNTLVSFSTKDQAYLHAKMLSDQNGGAYQVVPSEINLFLPVAM